MVNKALEKYRHDKEIIRLTIEQIKKDFGSYLPEIILTGNSETVFEELKNQIESVLKSLNKENKIILRGLLYKIDVKETDISAGSFTELAEKIIQREFHKVLTRKFFSS
jgi:hypothetical protein